MNSVFKDAPGPVPATLTREFTVLVAKDWSNERRMYGSKCTNMDSLTFQLEQLIIKRAFSGTERPDIQDVGTRTCATGAGVQAGAGTGLQRRSPTPEEGVRDMEVDGEETLERQEAYYAWSGKDI